MGILQIFSADLQIDVPMATHAMESFLHRGAQFQPKGQAQPGMSVGDVPDPRTPEVTATVNARTAADEKR